jgi:orotidine-5'-phosphate decarboxylase
MSPARKKVSFTRTPTPIVALDVPNSAAAAALVERLSGLCTFYKVGSELFTAAGPAVVEYLRARGADVFLDLKLHDIPNTVERAAEAAAALGAQLITVHATGGSEMIRAAVEGVATGARRGGGKCEVLAVTVLTSLDLRRLGVVWGRKIGSAEREVVRLTQLAARAGAHGLVCSGRELSAVRQRFGDRLTVLVPGVRPAGAARGDQVRVITPRDAARNGADYVILGRVVTRAVDPAAAYTRIVAELSSD